MVSPVVKRQMCEHLIKTYNQSVRKACFVLSFTRSMWYYQSVQDDRPVIDKLTQLAEQLPVGSIPTMEECGNRAINGVETKFLESIGS